jgi:hypothetical protein
MATSLEALIGLAISPGEVRADGQLTSPRSYGVYQLPQSVNGTRLFRLGNHPVRLYELEREFGACQLVHLFRQRSHAVAAAEILNRGEP